ncbi:MAG: alpha-1,2-fucosyltransferase [Gammaproteobacteria bacterium]|nr:alpha-1,2-fucosyltransferase [Gammaproteobacteria bacterium]
MMLDVMKGQNQHPIYAFPRLSKTDLLFVRIGGNGLGNLMITWARCLAASERHGWRMVWPTWASFKPKNWRVNPYDHRTYSDLFVPNERYVSGWRKPWCLARHRWISEHDALNAPVTPGSVVEFRGMKDFFAPFREDHALVYRELRRMARGQHLAAFSESSPAPIGIHVRRGDFIQRASYEDMVSDHNSLLPLRWYTDALQAVRKKAGSDFPAFVFSDGTETELEELLTLPRVRRVDYGSGLGDLLGLSRSRLLIASGSTFSMWGSFLGQVPTIWHPGKLLQPLLMENPQQEIEWAPGDHLPDWIEPVLTQDKTSQ